MILPSRAELEAMTILALRKHVREMNEVYALKRYAKVKKADLINMIVAKHGTLKSGKAPAAAPAAAAPAAKKSYPFKVKAKKAEVKTPAPISASGSARRVKAKKVNKSVAEVSAMLQKKAPKKKGKTVNKSVAEVSAMLQK